MTSSEERAYDAKVLIVNALKQAFKQICLFFSIGDTSCSNSECTKTSIQTNFSNRIINSLILSSLNLMYFLANTTHS